MYIDSSYGLQYILVKLLLVVVVISDLDLNTESIFIPDVDHSNAGVYLCKVTNKHGQAGMEYHLTVVGKFVNMQY